MADTPRNSMKDTPDPSIVEIINNERRYQEKFMRAHLEQLGIQVSVQHFTGDSSFPTEYRLRYSFVEAAGPTLDMAVAAFVEKLLRHVPVEKAQSREDEDTQHYMQHYYLGGE